MGLEGARIQGGRDGEDGISDIRAKLAEINVGEVQVQEFGGTDDILIRVESQGLGDGAEQSAEAKVRAVLEDDYQFRRVEVVGPTVSNELRLWGSLSVVAALMAIMIYIWFRFEWQFAVAAVLALLHDTIATVALFSLTQMEFNLSTVAAVLMIAGYSINDTVVVFDRIREYLKEYGGSKGMFTIINSAVNSTLGRTLNTSMTTLIVLLAIFIFGGASIMGFMFALIVGVIVGTYSSIFIATPVMFDTVQKKGLKPEKKKEEEEVEA